MKPYSQYLATCTVTITGDIVAPIDVEWSVEAGDEDSLYADLKTR